MIEKEIPNAAMKRMPAYLHYLRSLHADGSATISSSAIAWARFRYERTLRWSAARVNRK